MQNTTKLITLTHKFHLLRASIGAMKWLIVLSVMVLGFVMDSLAQNENGCGTVSGRSKWLKNYQLHPDRFEKGGNETIYVPLTIHLLGSDQGSGYFSQNSLLDAMCTLNNDFVGANLHFYIEGEVNYIDNSTWNNHSDILTGAEMMFANNRVNTLNIYFVSNPAGNCGYNLPYAGIANNKGCSGPEDHTFAHEVGHALRLPHPFIGWEGGVSHDNSVEHNYDDPAPEEVYYDYTLFQEVLYTDTLIIDTALVELVDGSNCLEAADGFCDTAPDYLSSRWACNGNAESPTSQTDPDGNTFRSDGSLIMGYSLDNCQARFTPEQIAAMRAFLLDQRPNWLYNQTPAPVLGETPSVPLSPFVEGIAAAENTYFEWPAVENATHYILQVSPFSRFNILQVNTIVEGNSYTAEKLNPNRDYYWRIRPFNNYEFCAGFSTTFSFRTSDVTSTDLTLADIGITIFPNPKQDDLPFQMQVNQIQQNLELTLFDTQGRREKVIKMERVEGTIPIDLEILEKGVYFLQLKNESGTWVERLVVN